MPSPKWKGKPHMNQRLCRRDERYEIGKQWRWLPQTKDHSDACLEESQVSGNSCSMKILQVWWCRSGSLAYMLTGPEVLPAMVD